MKKNLGESPVIFMDLKISFEAELIELSLVQHQHTWFWCILS